MIAHIGECDANEKKLFESGSYILYSNTGLACALRAPRRPSATPSATAAESPLANPPSNPPSEQFTQTKNGTFYIKNNDTTKDKKIKNIVETILESVN